MSVLDTEPSRSTAIAIATSGAGDETTRLPPDMTCTDCARVRRCDRIYGGVRGDTVCGFTRNRFRPRGPAP